MTKVKKIIIGILLLSFCLSAASCKKKKEAFNHEVLRAAAKRNRIAMIHMYSHDGDYSGDFEDLIEDIGLLSPENA